jgi:hypothetical protein
MGQQHYRNAFPSFPQGCVMIEQSSPAESTAPFDAMQFLQGAMSMEELAARHEKILRRLKKYELGSTLALIGGLLTWPENHSCTIRLEAICHMAAAACCGNLALPSVNVREWLNGPLLKDDLGAAEDSPEDVFVSCIVSWAGTTRIFEGIWEANDFYLQTLLSAVDRPAVRDVLSVIFRPVRALLLLSDTTAGRSGVERFSSSAGRPGQPVRLPEALAREAARRVTFSTDDLAKMEIAYDDLEPFMFDRSRGIKLFHETIGHTSLERRPVVGMDNGRVVLALPTAVSAAVRRFVLETAATLGLTDRVIRSVEQDHLARLLEAMEIGWEVKVFAGPHHDEESRMHELWGTFDTGGYAQVFLAHDNPAGVLAEGLFSYHEVSQTLRRLVAAGREALGNRPDFRHGITLLVHGGFGRGFAADFGEPVPGWSVIGLSLHDFVLLSREDGFSAVRAWKLLRQIDELKAVDIEFMNPNGFVNLYAFIEQEDFGFVPSGVTHGLIMVGANFVVGLRERLRRSFDFHAVRSWKDESWFEVERRRPSSYFADDDGRPMYVSPEVIRAGHLLGCVEAASRVFWLACWDRISGAEHRSVVFQVWDMALEWLGRAGEVLGESLPGLPIVSAFVLTFPDLQEWSGDGPFEDGSPERPEVDCSGVEVRIMCSRRYLTAFAVAENVGDRWMVEAIVEGGGRLVRIDADSELVRRTTDRIVPDTRSRFFHTVPATTTGDFVRAAVPVPAPRLIQAEDSFRSRFGLPKLSGYVGTGGSLSQHDASPLLAKAVDALWERIRALLVALDQGALIERALINHEAIEKDRSIWGMTAAAVLAVHSDPEATLAAAVRRESDRAQVSTSTRALAEMALCTSPLSGGRAPTTIDVDQLVADVAYLIEVANVNDALHYGLYAGELVVRPNMTLDFNAVLTEAMRGGYLRAHGDRSYTAAASRYEAYFESPAESVLKLEPAFEAACIAEFGASFRSLGDIALMFATRAARDGASVLRMRRSEVVGAIGEVLGSEPTLAEGIVRRLSLMPRPRWDENKPTGASQRDWYPWRFGRKLSLTRRPLIVLSDETDPEMLVCAGLFDRSLRHLASTWVARLPAEMFDTNEMRAWIGAAIDRVGHAFNHEVCGALRTLGLQAEVEVSMQRFGAPKELGDVDVLAWRPGTSVVFGIECKRLSQARTLGEIGERLKEYTDLEPTGKSRTPVKKHLDRMAFLKVNPDAVARYLGLQTSPLLQSCIVTENLVPMQFSAKAAALVDVYVDMSGLSAAFG